MNKSEFIDAIVEKSGVSKKDVTEVVNAYAQVVTETLAKKDSISLVGFGTFSVSERAARKGFNPLTKEEITIAASTVPKFKAGKSFKEAVNVK